MARPSIYADELAERICEELMLGRSLRSICENEAWAPAIRTVTGWLARDEQGFCHKYTRARQVQADMEADAIQEIADNIQIGEVKTDKLGRNGQPFTEVRRADMIEHRKLRIGVRQWNAQKLRPKVYGAQLGLDHSGSISDGTAKDSTELMNEIMELITSGRVKLPNGVEFHVEDDEDEPPAALAAALPDDEDDYSDIA